MVKRRGVRRKTSKKVVKKSSKVVSKKTRSRNAKKISVRIQDSFKFKKQRILVNLLRFFVFFVICLVLYFVTNNYVLWVLFGIGTIIGGAISFALLLVYIGFVLMRKK